MEHGEIPNGAIVMMNTGKHKLYPNRNLFYGTDTPGDTATYHNPGLEPTAARWLMHNRQIKGMVDFSTTLCTISLATVLRSQVSFAVMKIQASII